MTESWATSEGTRKSMLANKRRDTSTELKIRRIVHARGLRYRVDFAPVPGLRRRADIVFTRARIAVFIDGCFWHGCPIHGTSPKANAGYWGPKLAANVARDRDTDERLEAAGWRVLRFWEHEAPEAVASLIESTVRSSACGVVPPEIDRFGRIAELPCSKWRLRTHSDQAGSKP